MNHTASKWGDKNLTLSSLATRLVLLTTALQNLLRKFRKYH